MTLVAISISFALGLLLENFLGPNSLFFLLPFPVCCLFIQLFCKKSISKWCERIFQTSILGSFLLVGGATSWIQSATPSNHISKVGTAQLNLKVVVLEDSRPTPFGHKAVVACLADEEGKASFCGKILVYFSGEVEFVQEYEELELELKIQPLKIKHAGYQSYLERKGIWVSAKAVKCSKLQSQNGLQPQLTKARRKVKTAMQEFMPDSAMAGLANAMLLGDKSGLDREMKQDFAQAGMSHILAISGLHIGILFFFLQSLLSFLDRWPKASKIKVILTLVLLVVYAVMTGAAPAVCRAVLMIGMVQAGKLFHRSGQGLNMLAAAGLILMVRDPECIYQVGFQLSFAAVAGIMIFAPQLQAGIQKRWKLKNGKLISAACVCIAAQAFTAPLVFIHFGQFPTYFLFANLLLLPLVAFSVNLGFVGILLYWIPGLNAILFGMLDFCLWILASLSKWFAHLPGSVVQKISLHEPGLLILVGLCLLGAFIAIKPKLPSMFGQIGLKNGLRKA